MSKEDEKVLVLRCCAADGSSSHGFTWPRSGAVSAPDWSSEVECGNGLHGWLWGAGDIRAAREDIYNAPDALWLVVEVLGSEIVDLEGKVKFPRGEVIFAGAREEAFAMVTAKAPAGTLVMFGTATAGYSGTATAGDSGTATAGYRGTATAGDRGTATAGDRGTATAGYRGTATAGYSGTATAGDSGTATAGKAGRISIGWWDEKRKIVRTASAEIAVDDEDTEGLKPGVKYRIDVVDGKPQFVEAK